MIYVAQKDSRTAMEQLKDGWFLKYHPKMGQFYTYDPNNESDTYGSRGIGRQECRNLVKKGVLESVGITNEILRLKELEQWDTD